MHPPSIIHLHVHPLHVHHPCFCPCIICLPICLSIHLPFTHLLSIHPSFHLPSIYPSVVHLLFHPPPIHLSNHHPLTYLLIYLSTIYSSMIHPSTIYHSSTHSSITHSPPVFLSIYHPFICSSTHPTFMHPPFIQPSFIHPSIYCLSICPPSISSFTVHLFIHYPSTHPSTTYHPSVHLPSICSPTIHPWTSIHPPGINLSYMPLPGEGLKLCHQGVPNLLVELDIEMECVLSLRCPTSPDLERVDRCSQLCELWG